MELGVSVQPYERIYLLRIPQRILDEILEHARREYPIEACGVLLGSIAGGVGTASRAVPLRNLLASSKAFWFDVREWMQVIIDSRREGLEYIGLYHTHARDEPLPSLSDRHRMLEAPGEIWLILALRPGREPKMAAYRIDDYGSSIMRVPVEVF
ncbi:MAG: M67 family metallopeptidase [Thermoproteales archaeon]|nr:M67 family metallopeptidase [Thermoproteales archaeon]